MVIRRNPLRDPVVWVRIGLALMALLALAALCYIMFHGLPDRPVY